MDDLERRIVEEFGYRPGGTAWTPALRVDPKEAGMTPEQVENMAEMIRRMMEKRKE